MVALYWLILGLAWWRKVSLLKRKGGGAPFSLLIATHRPPETMAALLEELSQWPAEGNWEVILAVGRPLSEYKPLIQRWGERLPLRWVEATPIPSGWSPKKYALWRACAAAQYDWCLLRDDDTWGSAPWLTQMQKALQAPYEAIIAPAWLVPQGTLASWLAAYEAALVQVEALGRAALGFPYMATGRGWAVRRKWLALALYRWRGELSGDDDLTLQLIPSQWVGLSPACTFSAAPSTFLQAVQRKWRHLQTARHYPWGLRLSLGIFPFLQVAILPLLPWAPSASIALLFPPLAKSLALRLFRAPLSWLVILLDWPLVLLQGTYLVGAQLRKTTWCIFA
ncbi:MAG: glycosyltransferase family 2 protein [Bacteroidia bacterium]|nr:glycosyltransferase family 2 protein [Bacteroidia bacterium]MDW8089398.1 glycosyltransferase family 2 protein [Bacteroidia bacterium]